MKRYWSITPHTRLKAATCEKSAQLIHLAGAILCKCQALPQPFTSNMMLTQINDALKDAAMAEALKISPKIHAVSRCQISNIDYQWIKSQLVKNNGWSRSKKSEVSASCGRLTSLYKLNLSFLTRFFSVLSQ